MHSVECFEIETILFCGRKPNMATSPTKPSTPTYHGVADRGGYHGVADRRGFLGLTTKSFFGWANYRDLDHRHLKRSWALSRDSTHWPLNPLLTTATFGMFQMELGEWRNQSLRHSLFQKETRATQQNQVKMQTDTRETLSTKNPKM